MTQLQLHLNYVKKNWYNMGFLNLRSYTIHKDFLQYESFILSIPKLFENGEGEIIYKGRNELRSFEYKGMQMIVKSYRKPNFINRFIYGFIRPSKAKRSYDNALKLMEIGVGTPVPVAYINIRSFLLFDKSYFITLKSGCSHVYSELFTEKFKEEELILREVGKVTATLHNNGMAHLDYGRGNILFEITDNKIKIELVDLNRMYFGNLDMKRGCKNLERLPATPQMHSFLAEEYAKARNMNFEKCLELIKKYRSTQPGKIDNLY